MEMRIGDRVLVLFDGYCALCNGAVRWLIKRDRFDCLRFAPVDDERVREILQRHGFVANSLQPETIFAVVNVGSHDEMVLTHSAAIVEVLKKLKQPWPWIAGLLGVIPRVVRDFFYRMVAGNRFKIRKRLTSCPVPAADERRHFIE